MSDNFIALIGGLILLIPLYLTLQYMSDEVQKEEESWTEFSLANNCIIENTNYRAGYVTYKCSDGEIYWRLSK